MYETQRILALIPARGGSKGILNKNITPLCGKPLIAYTIEAAKGSRYIDEIIVSTDSVEIAKVAKEFGAKVPFLRPSHLAQDDTRIIDVVLHELDALRNDNQNYDMLVLLQPTQPLRTAAHIDKSISCFYMNGKKPLVSVSPVKNHPIFIRYLNENNELRSMLDCSSTIRRQDLPKYYYVNGCIYINMVDTLSRETSFNDNFVPFVMEKQHSVDIDDLEDIKLAEFYMC